jgi:hypothetical protein
MDGLPIGQSIRLGEEVTHEFIMIGHYFAGYCDGIRRLGEPDELCRYDAPLVHQLIERVLAIGTRLSEYNLTTRVW